jgi:hypothetical protein
MARSLRVEPVTRGPRWTWNHRALRALTSILFALGVVLSVHAVSAQSKTADLAKQLTSDDYRVRTQAALALGSTGDEAAIKKRGLLTEEHPISTKDGLRLFLTRRMTVLDEAGEPQY